MTESTLCKSPGVIFAVVCLLHHCIHTVDSSPGCTLPLFGHNEECVETCPDLHLGNHSTGLCEPFPNDYRVLFNATIYYADINFDTPLGTPVIHLKVTLDNEYFQNPQFVFLDIVRNDAVEQMFVFGNGDDDKVIYYYGSIDPRPANITIERTIVYANTPSTILDQQTDFDFDVTVVVVPRMDVGLPIFVEDEALGLVRISKQPVSPGTTLYKGSSQIVQSTAKQTFPPTSITAPLTPQTLSLEPGIISTQRPTPVSISPPRQNIQPSTTTTSVIATPPGVSQTRSPVIATPPSVSQTRSPAMATPPSVSQTRSPAMATPPSVSQTRSPAIATPPSVSQTRSPVIATPPSVSQTRSPAIATPLSVSQTSLSVIATPPGVSQTRSPAIATPLSVSQTSLSVIATPPGVSQTRSPAIATPLSVSQTRSPAIATPLSVLQTSLSAIATPLSVSQTRSPAIATPLSVLQTSLSAIATPLSVLQTTSTQNIRTSLLLSADITDMETAPIVLLLFTTNAQQYSPSISQTLVTTAPLLMTSTLAESPTTTMQHTISAWTQTFPLTPPTAVTTVSAETFQPTTLLSTEMVQLSEDKDLILTVAVGASSLVGVIVVLIITVTLLLLLFYIRYKIGLSKEKPRGEWEVPVDISFMNPHCPEGTTHCPEGTTHSPEGTTHCPEGSTHCPEGLTHCPEGTTHCPKGTTHCPEGTMELSETRTEEKNSSDVVVYENKQNDQESTMDSDGQNL